MQDFWYFARRLLRKPLTLSVALLCAALSAGGMGLGLASLGPIMEIIVNEKGSADSLYELAQRHNAGAPLLEVPEWLLARLPEDALESVGAMLAVLAVLTVFGATCNFLHQSLSLAMCTKVVALVRLDVFRHAIRLPLTTVVQRGPAEFTSRILRDSAELQGGLVSLTSNAAAQFTKGIAAFAVAIWFDWRLAIVATALAPVLAIILRKAGKRIRRGMHGALRAQESLLRVCGEALQGLRAAKTASAEAAAVHRFNVANREQVVEELRVRTVRALVSPLMETIAVLVVLVLAYFAARQILRGSMGFDTFVLALGALGAAGSSFRPLTQLWNNVQASSAPAQRLRQLLNESREDAADASLPPLPRHIKSIVLEGVTFRYPGALRPALSDLNFQVQQGEHLAIVGPNGCGKTTLVALLARLAEPDSGRISVDGRDISRHSIRSLRGQEGFVTQDAVMIHASIFENIKFGLAGVSEAAVKAAAIAAHADSFISELAQGYQTVVSEAGASLSGGQRQRIAIARAILRNPAILVLDEATSQVDSHSEDQINSALEEFGAGRTVIVVAHRLSTMLRADRIIVLDEGRLVDEGSHQELAERCPTYQRIIRGQVLTA